MSGLAFADRLLGDAAALVIVKATVVLALASLASVAASDYSAARRHMLWLVALSSCLWLVVSSPVVPAMMIHLPVLARQTAEAAAPPRAAAGSRLPRAAPATAYGIGARVVFAQSVRRSPARSIPLPRHSLIALWIIGCAALLVRDAVGFVRATRLARRASAADDDETMRELARARAMLGVTREVRLGYSADIDAPVTFGSVKPYVLLPTDARSWPVERRRAVLVHETAHIARGDWLSQTMGHVACALFWFHPLVWRAFARLRDEAERATDDCVLHSGMPAVEYATHLLELARQAGSARPGVAAVGIVSMNNLESRFLAMFDDTRSRASVTSRARAVTAGAALAIVCPLASLRVGAPVPRANAPRSHAALQHASSALTSIVPEPSDARAATVERDVRRIAHIPELRVAVVRQMVPQPPLPPIAVIGNAAPSAVAHPDFSGKWVQDTVAGPVVELLVTDSTIITQSSTSISFESRGHTPDAPTHNRFLAIPFDGAQSTGMTQTGSAASSYLASATWGKDTLIVKTYAQSGAHDFLTFERMTLSPDGNTMFITNSSFADGRYRWGGPVTFVLRRMAR